MTFFFVSRCTQSIHSPQVSASLPVSTGLPSKYSAFLKSSKISQPSFTSSFPSCLFNRKFPLPSLWWQAAVRPRAPCASMGLLQGFIGALQIPRHLLSPSSHCLCSVRQNRAQYLTVVQSLFILQTQAKMKVCSLSLSRALVCAFPRSLWRLQGLEEI